MKSDVEQVKSFLTSGDIEALELRFGDILNMQSGTHPLVIASCVPGALGVFPAEAIEDECEDAARRYHHDRPIAAV